MRRSVFRLVAITGVVAACSDHKPIPAQSAQRSPPRSDTAAADSVVAADARRDTAPVDAMADSSAIMVVPAEPTPTRHPLTPPVPPRHALSPLADTIAQYLVFAPTVETWFLAAGRGKRPLVDVGRVDIDLRKDPRRRAAYLDAVRALTPFPVGTRFRLRGAWGQDDVTVTGFDFWNGRIVATIAAPPNVDSLARVSTTWIATAERTDSVTPPVVDTCARGPGVLSDALRARATVVRDSIEQWLKSQPPPPFTRLVASEHTVTTQAAGCFGHGRVLAMAVDLRAGNNEWIRERMVAIDTAGVVQTLRVDDLRFKAHDLLYAMDGDGDGVDDIAARGLTEAAGGTVVMRMVPPNRLQRLASGFAWESR
ncbi:MAG TPA: hypothetical protein VNW46_15800 [Gemmatimonadaceae bacterium]|nr:hypothetical protein [Gemmatimonadaceae bacterium]